MRNRLLLVLILTALLLVGARTVYAQGPEVPNAFLLLLPVSPPDTIPPDVETPEAYTQRVAQPVLERLTQLREQGHVGDFELLLERHAIRVTLPDDRELRALSRLNGVERMLPLEGASLTCAAQGARAVQDALEVSQVGRSASVSAQATNPNIYVYYRGDYGGIEGGTDPNVTVQMTLKDSSGTVKVMETTTSSSSGYYYFYPDFQACLGYEWIPKPGDRVRVTAAGNTVSTVVVDISAFPNPNTDTVTGNTAPNRTVEIWADSTRTDCDYTSFGGETTSDGNGDISETFNSGFDRSVSVAVLVYDANDNYTYNLFYAPRITINYMGNPSGYLKPDVGYTAMLRRGENTVSTFTGTTDEEGQYGGSFTETIQTGDVIEVSGGGHVISTTFVAMSNLSFDLENDRITGTLGSEGANRVVKVNLGPPWEYTCLYESTCVTATTDVSGDFTLDFASGSGMQRGDDDYGPTIYDVEGNPQEFRGQLVVPIVEVSPYSDYVRGTWREPGVVVTATLRDSGGAVEATDTDTTSSYDGDFSIRLPKDSIEPGDQVDVSDGAYTLTVASVPTLTTHLNATQDTAYVTSSAGSLWATNLYEHRLDPDRGSVWYMHCYTHTSNVLPFGDDIDAMAQDYVRTHERDPDGHAIEAYSHAFAINAEKDSNHIDGYIPEPGMPVTITLMRNGMGFLETITTTTDSYGQYYGFFSSSTITEGDTVRVDRGLMVQDLSIPNLTVEEDPAHNRVMGQAPANASLEVYLNQRPTWNNWETLTTADGDGDYVADFDGIYEWNCTEAEVGACTQPRTTYYDEADNSVYVFGSFPPDVLADDFEPDAVYTTATSYAGLQSHTFHAYTDTDWISFTVDSDELGASYHLRTMDLGVNANTQLYLYRLEGAVLTELESDTSYSPAESEIVWAPSMSGTYYVKVEPYSDYDNTEDCGSTYDFFIARHRLYLPLMLRNY